MYMNYRKHIYTHTAVATNVSAQKCITEYDSHIAVPIYSESV